MSIPQNYPILSVVIPVYNREDTIARALKSVLDQQYPNYEVIVVDDGSTDKTPQVVCALSSSRLVYHRLPQNMERMRARNEGVRLSRGEWIVFLDSDDELAPDALDVIAEHIRNIADQRVGVFFFGSVDPESPNKVLCWVKRSPLRAQYEAVVSRKEFWGEFLPAVRREVFEQFIFPEETITELLFWYRVATKWDFIVVDFPPLLLCRSSWGGRSTAVAGRKRKGALFAKGFEMILRDHGDVIRKFGNESFYWKRIASNYALAGYRRHAFIAALKVIRYEPWLPTGYALALAALLGPNAAGVAYQTRQALYYKLVANKRFLLRAKRS